MIDYLFSEELKANGVKIITNEYAWRHIDALKVVRALHENDCVILGGDVLKNNFEYTYDNWYYEYDRTCSLDKNISQSVNNAIKYINWYQEKFGDNFYYVIVATKKADYILHYE